MASRDRHYHPLDIDIIGEVTVARFTERNILDERSVDAISQELYRLAEGSCAAIILNFAAVQGLSSTMVGKLFALHKRLRSKGKRLVLCSIGPELREVFEVWKLPHFCCCCADEQEALRTV